MSDNNSLRTNYHIDGVIVTNDSDDTLLDVEKFAFAALYSDSSEYNIDSVLTKEKTNIIKICIDDIEPVIINDNESANIRKESDHIRLSNSSNNTAQTSSYIRIPLPEKNNLYNIYLEVSSYLTNITVYYKKSNDTTWTYKNINIGSTDFTRYNIVKLDNVIGGDGYLYIKSIDEGASWGAEYGKAGVHLKNIYYEETLIKLLSNNCTKVYIDSSIEAVTPIDIPTTPEVIIPE